MTEVQRMPLEERLDGLIAMGAYAERAKITKWLRSLDEEGGDINRFLPTTLANWIDERMHEL